MACLGPRDRYLGEDFNTGTELSGQIHPSQINTVSWGLIKQWRFCENLVHFLVSIRF